MTTQEQQEARKKRLAEFENITFLYSANPGDEVPFSFKYKGDLNDIHCLQPSCGCTTVEMVGNTIKGVLSIDEADKMFVEGDDRDSALLTRSISVYFGDDPFYLVGDDKIRKINPDKIQIALTIQGMIQNPNKK